MLKALLLVGGDQDIVVINVPWYLSVRSFSIAKASEPVNQPPFVAQPFRAAWHRQA